MAPVEIPITATTHDGRWMLGIVANGTQRELRLYAAPQAGVMAGKAQWKRVVANEDEMTGLAYMNDALYVNTHKGASRFLVKKLDLKAPDFAAAPVVVPASERVITGIAGAKDALYIESREGNASGMNN